MRVNIDKKIDENRCPEPSLCVVGTTCYSEQEREHICYKCWLRFCKENRIEIDYGEENGEQKEDYR